jgi:ABC-2 type transport system ATP-binding protein
MSALLEFDGVVKQFGAVLAIKGVNLQVERGSILALLGPNGAGKSTLFGCLLGLIHPTAGRVRCAGEEISDGARKQFGYLPERIALYPHRTVKENGLFFARLKNAQPEDLEYQLKRVGLYHLQGRKVRQLSKGMLQRLGLAIALCGQPQLFVLDEPFNGLDPVLLDESQEIIIQEHQRGATFLIATHTISAIEPLATHVAVMLYGELAASGTVEQLRSQYDEASLEAIYRRVARRERFGHRQEALA